MGSDLKAVTPISKIRSYSCCKVGSDPASTDRKITLEGDCKLRTSSKTVENMDTDHSVIQFPSLFSRCSHAIPARTPSAPRSHDGSDLL